MSGSDEPGDGGPLLGGRYRVIERIGAGGAATVFLAEDSRLGRRVAVKRLHADSPDHAAERFLREAKLGAALSHPNLITVFDAFGDEDNLVIVMERIDGPDLGVALRSGSLEEAVILPILADVAAALDHIHAAGIVHRDVKPSNILLAPDGSARLTDLGIARVLEDTQTTQAGQVVGTTAYMAPEQLSGQPVGPPADVYALALSAYEALSGSPARTGMPAQIAYQAMEGAPPDIRDVRPATPAAAAEVLGRSMSRRPEERPVSAGALVAELRRALAGDGEAPRTTAVARVRPVAERVRPLPPSPPETPRNGVSARGVGLGLLAALVLAVALVAVLSTGGDDPADPAAAVDSTTAEEDSRAKADRGAGGSDGLTASPEAAVQDFYELAAADDFEGAIAVATPSLVDQLGGSDGIAGTFSTLESIEFTTLEPVAESDGGAEVELATVATHTDRVEECTGSASLIASGGSWLVEEISGINCDVVG